MTRPELQLRHAGLGDVLQLAELCDVVQRLHLRARPDFFHSVNQSALVRFFSEAIAESRLSIWIAERNGTAVGYAMASFSTHPANTFGPERRVCEIEHISVSASAQRQGVARQLCEAVSNEARQRGFTQIEATCWAFNDVGQAVFRALGFSAKTHRFEWRLAE